MMDLIWEKILDDEILALESFFKVGTLKVGDKLPLMHWEGNLDKPPHPSNTTYTELILTTDWKQQLRKHYEENLVG